VRFRDEETLKLKYVAVTKAAHLYILHPYEKLHLYEKLPHQEERSRTTRRRFLERVGHGLPALEDSPASSQRGEPAARSG
jgi:hypothetical protein